MNENAEDIEIDLVRLFKYLLSKYKAHLLLGILFSVLLFSYKFYKFEYSDVPLEEINNLFTIQKEVKLPNGQKKTEKTKVNYRLYKQNFLAQESEYDTALKNIHYQKQKLSSEIANLRNEEDIQKEYMKNSILYNMQDPAAYLECDFLFIVSNKYQNNNSNSNYKNNSDNTKSLTDEGMSNSPVLDFAKEFISSKDLIEKVANHLNIPVKNSKKQITELTAFRKITNNTFVIEAKGNSPEVISFLKEHIKDFYQRLNEAFKNEYQITYSQTYYGSINSSCIEKLKTAEEDKLNSIINGIENKINAISNLQDPPPIEEKMIDLDSYKTITYIKFALIGFIAGIFVGLSIFGCKYLFDGKLKDETYLQKLFSIKNLACIHDGSFIQKNHNEEKRLSQSVEYLCKDKTKLSIVSTLDIDEIYEPVKVVENTFYNTSTEVIVKKPFEIKEITGSDAVLIIEKLDSTNIKDAVSEINFLKEIECKIIGIAYA